MERKRPFDFDREVKALVSLASLLACFLQCGLHEQKDGKWVGFDDRRKRSQSITVDESYSDRP